MADFVIWKHMSDVLSVQSSLILWEASWEFLQVPPKFSCKEVWSSINQLLPGTITALQPLAMDAARSACHALANIHCELLLLRQSKSS